MAKRKKDDDTAMGCVVYAVLGLILMPVVGLFLVCSKDPEKKFWGCVLMVVGIAFLAIMGIR